MNKNSVENEFSVDIDSYLNGVENINSSGDKEYKKLLEIGKLLADKDFSKNMNKKLIYEKCLKKISKDKEGNIMNKFKIASKVAAASLAFVVAGALIMQTPFAKNLITVVNKVTLNGGGIVESVKDNEPKKDAYEVPVALKGKLFDKNGKEVKELTKGNYHNLYTSDGEKIAYFSVDGYIETENEVKTDRLVINDINDINKYTGFTATVPSYLPDGYKFDRAEFYKDKDGNVKDNKYINIYYTNSKTLAQIYIQERLNCKETQTVSGTTEDVSETKINGLKAAVTENSTTKHVNIDWESDKVIYSISIDNTTVDEAKKVAESIQVK